MSGSDPRNRIGGSAAATISGSRPLEHLHITAAGRVVFCCEDYDEVHTVGDLTTQTVDEVLSGDEMAKLRRWAYGVDDAPDDFICRNCLFALVD